MLSPDSVFGRLVHNYFMAWGFNENIGNPKNLGLFSSGAFGTCVAIRVFHTQLYCAWRSSPSNINPLPRWLPGLTRILSFASPSMNLKSADPYGVSFFLRRRLS